MTRVRTSLQQGIMPAEDLLDALLIFTAGIVLLTPGFITDIFGLILLVPETRKHFKIFLRSKFDSWIKNQHIQVTRFDQHR